MYPDITLAGYLVHSNDIRWIRFTMIRAIRCGRSDIIKLLPTTIIDYKILQLAASLGQTYILSYLLDHSNIDINTFDSKLTTLLDLAIGNMCIGTMNLLANRGCISTRSSYYLRLLCLDPNTDIKDQLLYETYDKVRRSLSFDTTHEPWLNIIKVLLESGADPNISDTGYTLLHHAMFRKQLDLAILLIKHGADVNASERYNDHTPLHTATFGGYMEGVMLLVEHGANIYTRSKCGDTPLYNAEVAGYSDIADYLRSR
jgi:ankyrin repeat protein